ncbi:unnamed protein product [Paramecium sonneborni]|uniref:Transmembrane protein n=1 Tax=Paramecium sonneborni TaxID=65129 RepID=A0A8S1M4W7_9CILI|nr:unnamed protein product [Paramecium sonneborni]
MNIEEIYSESLRVIFKLAESIQENVFDQTFIVCILIGIASFVIGNQYGKSKILISKKQKEKLEQCQNLKAQTEKSKDSLQKEQKKLSKLTQIFVAVIIFINLILILLEITIVTLEIRFGLSLLLVIIPYSYKKYENFKLNSIKHNLEQTEKETKQIILDIQHNLGNNIITLIQGEKMKEKMEEMKKKMQLEIGATRKNLEKLFEDQYKIQIEDLKKKIKTLEDKEFLNKTELQNFKRSVQTHKTEPIQKQVQNKNEDETQILKQKIQYLQKEGQIQKDMISKVINLKWCEECQGLKIHCIELYFENARNIGEEYNQKLQELEKEYQVKS